MPHSSVTFPTTPDRYIPDLACRHQHAPTLTVSSSEPSARVHEPQTVPKRIQSPIAGSSTPSQRLSRVATASGTATHGHDLGGAPDESDHASPYEGGTKNEDGSFTIKASKLGKLRKEYVDLMNIKENDEIVLAEAMEATEQLNTVFNQIRKFMNNMSPMMKDIFLAPKRKSSGKTIETRNNWSHDKAATKAATERIVAQGATNVPITGT
ncbi:hypothetical protein M422DRAFT_265921 [Sphaerobolus stellatus SS14]|uniref:Uncharacterized protein n=1 Tax=Sphaerobolus stellatus (strain SS14) TaxID=990650 RepID=A0A0C9USQ6_SPHS4|nr:hypothetical protein M422DRAFT_265921 [Sphaerobolus stellatus SS14]